MKKAGLILLIALISAIVAIAGYRYVDKKMLGNSLPENNQSLGFTSNVNKTTSSAGNPDFVRAASMVSPAVVHIKTTYASSTAGSRNPLEEFYGSPRRNTPARASGSGVLISADGYIVTNNHVIENASEIEVVLPDRRSFDAKLIGRDPSTDLALVKVEGNNLPVVELGNSDDVQIGEWVLAVGYPLSLNSTVTAGIVSAKGRSIGILNRPSQQSNLDGQQVSVGTAIESFIQTDAAINPGNSGGALVNANGQLVGINSAIASQTGSYAGYGFAIPANLAKKVVADFREYGEVRRGYLGVSFPAPSVEDQILREQGIDPASVKGVYITGIQQGSAAAAAGLKTGDIILSVDGAEVYSSAEFSERIARHRPGDKVELTYLRGKNQNEVTVTLKGAEPTNAVTSGNNNSESGLHTKLGASFAPIPNSYKERYGLNSGVIVTELQRGGFLDAAGIPEGTIIISVNGRRIANVAELDSALESSQNGMARIDGVTPDGTRFVFNFPLGA
ncbi:trypsin-like peptidase domain-containing protein [Pontibacter silvestris]|uniref:Trypsin-like peptidase domain-containing protein n=1 Tax=Pontibacter silvestris TaxID=2305183 RepID=A0ABW4WVS6_9BACT|nr:trypsin-like peptidase domain-containing protein [Pontibacter silvestris]MCC9136974.1 trypsin-like peptidase domain-containing protein [Pontibacter silvestris]